MSGSVTGFATTPNTCGVLGLLGSNGAFITSVIGNASAIGTSLQSAAASLLNLPNVVEGIVLSDVQTVANNLTALAVGTIADFTAHLTSQFNNLVNNLSVAATQATAQAGLVSSGCNLPAMGSIGTTGGLSACGNMQNIFGSIMGAGQNLLNQIQGALNSVLSQVTSLIGGANISAGLSQIASFASQISGFASSIASMVTSEVSNLAAAVSDLISFSAASALQSLFNNPCAKQVLNVVGTPQLLSHLS